MCIRDRDSYMCLADFESYVAAQELVAKTYQDKEKWGQMSLINTANAGIFSADRSVEELSLIHIYLIICMLDVHLLEYFLDYQMQVK